MSEIISSNKSYQFLLLEVNQREKQIENIFQILLWLLRVPSDRFLVLQRIKQLLWFYQQDFGNKTLCFCHFIPVQDLDLHQKYKLRPSKSRLLTARSAIKEQSVCQLEKTSFLKG